jgi:FimV-like protein
VLASGLAVWIWRRPRREVVDPEALPSTFLDEDGIPRRRRPKITEVSEAAAEMARTVEALQQTQMLVRRGDEDAQAPATHAMDAEAHAGVQLELARALIAIGRPAAARIHLGSVLRQGSATQKLDAQDLAAQIG